MKLNGNVYKLQTRPMFVKKIFFRSRQEKKFNKIEI